MLLVTLFTSLLLARFGQAEPVKRQAPWPGAVAQIPLARNGVPLAQRKLLKRSRSGKSVLTSLAGNSYTVPVTLGHQTLDLLLDTGSSDTWVTSSNFSCFDVDKSPKPQSFCDVSTTLQLANTFKPVPNVNFNITYGGGQSVVGKFGKDAVKIGGLCIPNAQFAVADKLYGPESINGVLGLAYPALTASYSGTDPTRDDRSKNAVPYDPVFVTAAKQKITMPYFSIAVDRATSDQQQSNAQVPDQGYLGLGGIVNVPMRPNFVISTVLNFTTSGSRVNVNMPGIAGKPYYYAISINGYSFNGFKPAQTKTKWAFLDHGTSLTYVETSVCEAYNNQFTPPAKYNDMIGAYTTSCNATVPPFSVSVQGKLFPFDKKDLLLHSGAYDDNGVPICASGIADAGPAGGQSSYMILGETVFAPTQNMVGIVQRPAY